MPPWTKSRLERPGDNDPRRRTIFESSPQDPRLFSVGHGSGEERFRASEDYGHGRGVGDSVVSLSAIVDAPAPLEMGPPPLLQIPDPRTRQQRFSLLRFRYASDSQLSRTAKEHADAVPPVPPSPPSIITTSPTQEYSDAVRRRPSLLRPKSSRASKAAQKFFSVPTGAPFGRAARQGAAFEEPVKARTTSSSPAPPPYGDLSGSALALPMSRMSESSRSDGSLGDHGIYATTTTTTHTVSTTTTFFRLSRRKKDKGPLFPLPPKVQPARTSAAGNAPRPGTASLNFASSSRNSLAFPAEPFGAHDGPRQHSPSRSVELAVLRSGSKASVRSTPSSLTSRPRPPDNRGRSSTLGSLQKEGEDGNLSAPPLPQPPRTSMSTMGRPSLAGLFSLSRHRQASEPGLRNGLGSGSPGTPISTDPMHSPFNLPRPPPPVVIPVRQEGDTPAKYLARLEEVLHRGALVPLLSKSDDDFTRNVLRSYMRRFRFFEDAMDMAVRKLLMNVELPKETQQIDRTLQSFADRYHECNPGIFASPDEAYFIAFSILILHTDVFNKNNKHKMQKNEYLRNTQGQGVAPEILACYYDNVAYTPFIHVEDDVDFAAERLIAQRNSRKTGIRAPGTTSMRKNSSGPVDPYTLIMDGKVDALRVPLDDTLAFEDPFNYLGSGGPMNLAELHRTFFRSGVIQILSSRSRPDAFTNQATITNPSEAQVGVVDMKVTKVGILWRKDPKRKKARSPWQEWGAILTGSQLYFFRNASWVKSLIGQYENHQRSGRSGTPVVFKPPLEQFKPDFLLSTEDVVALVDSEYRKHKNAIVISRQTSFQEVFLADSEADMNDWLAKLNYAAAFRTVGVRMRGVIGGSLDGQKPPDPQDDGGPSKRGSQAEMMIRKGQVDSELARQVMEARRQILAQKIAEADDRLAAIQRQLDSQLRTARHLTILAPIQLKTREDVLLAALSLGTKIRWSRTEKWRVRCHRDILAMDLEEDLNLHPTADGPSDEVPPKAVSSPQSKEARGSKLGFGRLNSRTGSGIGRSSSRTARPPSNLPAGPRLFSMEDMFRSPSRSRAAHRAKGSWELPHLSFDRSESREASEKAPPGSAGTEAVSPTSGQFSLGRMVAEIAATPNSFGGQNQQDVLQEAGFFSPNPSVGGFDKQPETESGDDVASGPGNEGNDGAPRARRGLQRKLHSGYTPTHHRGKKDSTSTAGVSEDGCSINESEGLSRAAGSFTVHGRKASIVTFGSEWQNMSHEERSKLWKPPVHDGSSRLSAPSSIEDLRASTEGGREGTAAATDSGAAAAAAAAATALLTVEETGRCMEEEQQENAADAP